jgi:dTDP-4-dehydrorhamnose 3,5-epimerase
VLEPVVHRDSRGFFQETYARTCSPGMASTTGSSRTTIRARSEAFCAGCTSKSATSGQARPQPPRGAIYDVIVDLRRGSPTFGQWEAHVLDDERHHQLYVPVGFAHGFCVTSDVADVIYKCSTYDTALERGIAHDDPDLAIEWPDPEPIVLERDAQAPRLAQIADELPFTY